MSELRDRPLVLPSADFRERLERRIQAHSAGLEPVAAGWPGAAALLMGLGLLAAGTIGWEIARGGPGRREAPVDVAPPAVPELAAPHAIRAVRHPMLEQTFESAAIPFDTVGLGQYQRGGELAAMWTTR